MHLDFVFHPTVLVAMPLYNARNFVETAVRSILSQTYSDFVLFIINDGSTDGSPDVVQQFLGEKVVMVSQPNRGPGWAMNLAIRVAYERKIPYIARMDADDISLPNRLETLIALLIGRNDIAACSCNSHYIHPDTEEIIGTSVVPVSPHLIQWEIFHGLRGMIQGACLFHTQALYDVGGYREAFIQAEDTDLFLRLAERYELLNSSRYLYQIRLNPGSLSVNSSRESVFYQLYALDCSRRRRHHLSELDIDGFRSSLKGMSKIKLWREVKLLELWRDYLTHRNYASFVVASLLSPSRVCARILRRIDKKI
jgi:glycosyltransferase involved in cell wall biosynthesis